MEHVKSSGSNMAFIYKEPITEIQSKNLFNKIRDTKGTFHAKMGTVND